MADFNNDIYNLVGAPLDHLEDHSLMYDAKDVINYLQDVLPEVLRNSLRLRNKQVNAASNWNILERNSIYAFNNLEGTNTPDKTKLGGDMGYVFTINQGNSKIFIQWVIATGDSTSLAFRGFTDTLEGAEWHYLMTPESLENLVDTLQARFINIINDVKTSNQGIQDSTQKQLDGMLATFNSQLQAIKNGLSQDTLDALNDAYATLLKEFEDRITNSTDSLTKLQTDTATTVNSLLAQAQAKLDMVDGVITSNLEEPIYQTIQDKVKELRDLLNDINKINPQTMTFADAVGLDELNK